MDKVALAWSRLSRRTRDLAEELGILLIHVNDRPPYLKAAYKTASIARRSSCILLQLPPGPALPWTLLWARGKLICDVHTGMFHYRGIAEVLLNRPFRGLLTRCTRVLAHNEDAAGLLEGMLGRSIDVVYDPIPRIKRIEKPQLDVEDYIVLPASWAPDEPIEYVVDEVLSGPGPSLVITGKPRGRQAARIRRKARESGGRVVITGFLPEPQYHWLLANAKAVIGLTTWRYTVLSVVWEAAAHRKPLISSDTPTLRKLLGGYAVYFNPGVEGSLRSAIERLGEADAGGMAERLARVSSESINRLKNICDIT